MAVINSQFQTIICENNCGKQITFDVSKNKEVAEAAGNEWLKTLRYVQTVDQRLLAYCSDVCEVEGIKTGLHNMPQKKLIESGATPAQVAQAAAQAKAAELASAALKSGGQVTGVTRQEIILTQYYIELVGYVDQRKRPENFPDVVRFTQFIDSDSQEDLAKQVNNLLVNNFLRLGGVAVRLDPSRIEELGKLDLQEWTFVPMHMLTHVVPVIKPVSGMLVLGGGRIDAAQLSGTEGEVRQ